MPIILLAAFGFYNGGLKGMGAGIAGGVILDVILGGIATGIEGKDFKAEDNHRIRSVDGVKVAM